MAMSTLITEEEKYLDLPGGRRLAYAENGNPSSLTLIIFFHGAFGVGTANHLQKYLLEKDVHFVAPTLAGWGKSSPRSKDVPFHVALASDTTALIDHLYSSKEGLKIYISGGSFGTVPAQMLYGASFDIFPPGRNVVGCMVLAPFSPFKLHKDYTKSMTTPNYIAIGPLSQYIPFNLLQRIASVALKNKVKTSEKSEAFLRQKLFDKMGAEERAKFAKWREENGRGDGEVEREFGQNMTRSVQDSWEGFMEMADAIHGDWGFAPNKLDDEHNGRPILLVASEGDTMAPDAMAKWLAENYKNAHYRSVNGGHLAAMFHLNEMWKELFDL
jgi:pimeloyl-ACP methyl ester carboxylesterase